MNQSDAGVDTVDDMIVRLLSLRAIFAGQVVETTRRPSGSERERDIVNRAVGMNPTGIFPDERLRAIYQSINTQFRGFQEDILSEE